MGLGKKAPNTKSGSATLGRTREKSYRGQYVQYIHGALTQGSSKRTQRAEDSHDDALLVVLTVLD
jgi:hypothetical protein